MKTLAFADPCLRNIESVVTIGVFDGLHRGHQKIVEQCVETASELGCESVLISFSINPKMAKGREMKLSSLMSASSFEDFLAEKGVKYHCIIDFSDDMSKLTGEEFIALLCTSYKLRAMVVGSNFRCGNPSSSAGPAEIEKLLSEYTSSAFLKVVSPVLYNGMEVSSSLIRRCLLTGDTETASALLGRAYQVDLGEEAPGSSSERLLYSIRTLGQLLPKDGTYKTRVAGKASDAPTSNPVDCDATAVISGDCLALELQVRIKPDRLFFL